MVSKRMQKRSYSKFINLKTTLIAILAIACAAHANIATIDDVNLPEQSYWNGSDFSGPFISGGIVFSNNYVHYDSYDSWDGFAYSNITDTLTEGMDGQYNAIAGAGQGGTSNYAICYIGFGELPVITLNTEVTVFGLYVTNNNTTYYSLLNGSMFSKKFGGNSGEDKDWFKLVITGKNAEGIITGTVEFYLADYRFDDNNLDYIVDTWEFINLTSLGNVNTLEFNLDSSDTGAWGMNTPAYFALDTVLTQSQSPIRGPYIEAGINGYINPLNNGHHGNPTDSISTINPIFKDWAIEVVDYHQTPGVDFMWSDPNTTLGQVTGDHLDIFSLGDLSREQIKDGEIPGFITLSFSEPFGDVNGYDFVVFENGLISNTTTEGGSVKGELLGELAFVEVSSDGENFIRFPSVSLTEQPGQIFSTIEPDRVYNLAGKHPNAYGTCVGTPFDLSDIEDYNDVVLGVVDINNIRFVRIVDIPGTGDFYDNAIENIDPNTDPNWATYTNNHPIFDEWNTSLVPLYPSGGFDLEAIGILHEQNLSADIDLNGLVDIDDFNIFASAWHSRFGQPAWNGRCDLAEPKDNVIDTYDFDVFLSQWMQEENWILEK